MLHMVFCDCVCVCYFVYVCCVGCVCVCVCSFTIWCQSADVYVFGYVVDCFMLLRGSLDLRGVVHSCCRADDLNNLFSYGYMLFSVIHVSTRMYVCIVCMFACECDCGYNLRE